MERWSFNFGAGQKGRESRSPIPYLDLAQAARTRWPVALQLERPIRARADASYVPASVPRRGAEFGQEQSSMNKGPPAVIARLLRDAQTLQLSMPGGQSS